MGAAYPAERKSGAVATGSSQALMSVRGLGIRFKTSQGVWQATRKIDFDVAPGERVGIVGESGCGKTITGLSILRLLPNNLSGLDGSIMFDDIDLASCSIVLAIAVTGALGIGLTNGMIAVGIVMFPALARIVRARTLIVRQELYVDASRCFGAPTWHILWKHVLPNALQPVIVQVTLLLAAALLAEASLSFLGLGIQPPNPSWGAMLARAYQYMEIAPEQMYAPGFAILAVSLAFNALGESLRIVLDPTMKDR
jgi:ABC-type antimicrobial peptide transport system permease subunit